MICSLDGCERRVRPHNVAMRCARCKGVFCDAHRTGVAHNCTFEADRDHSDKIAIERLACKASSLAERV